MDLFLLNLLILLLNLSILRVFSREKIRLEILKNQVYLYVDRDKGAYEIRDRFYIYKDDLEKLKKGESIIVTFNGLVTYEPATTIEISVEGERKNGSIALDKSSVDVLADGKLLTIYFNERNIFLGVK